MSLTSKGVLHAALGLALGASCCGARAADFNGDGKQDIVWRLPAGNPLVWQMNGLGIGSQYALPTTLDAGSAIAAVGKFFGAAQPGGILWIDSSHNAKLWKVNNGAITQTCTIASGLDPNLAFLGVGDVNGDGTDDVLWRNVSSGVVSAHLLNGCIAPTTVALGTAGASLVFAGAGDVDGQGRADLLWRDASGNVVLWQIVNDIAAVTVTTLPAGTYATWQIAAVADFDGDAKADILWRNPSTNSAALWLMNGTSYTAVPVTAASATTFSAPDTIFTNGFDSAASRAPPLASDWTILAAADYTGDGKADVLLANDQGATAIWQMQGATVAATALFPPLPDMPFPGLTGWRLPLDRPLVMDVHGQVAVTWNSIAGSPAYNVYASSAHSPAAPPGIAITAPAGTTATALTFARSSYPGKRYLAITTAYHGLRLPPSPEAYIVEFSLTSLPYWGAMAIVDINRDGCTDILGALGDCQGNFTILSEANMGLAALRAPGRVYDDVRFADLDGDGIDDLIANTYSSVYDTNSQVLFFRGLGNNQFVEDLDFTHDLVIRGFGETVVLADFNNDGYLDVFLPRYSFSNTMPPEHSWLLLNDGNGHFTDVSYAAGVAMPNIPWCVRSEGAQAVDLDGNGWIDIYSGSHMFLNQGTDQNGVPHFTDIGAQVDPSSCSGTPPQIIVDTPSPANLPVYFDEGAKFIDWDNSGQLALALNIVYAFSPSAGIRVIKYDGVGHFSEVVNQTTPYAYMNQSFGLTAADINGDGLTDIVVAGGCDASFYTNPSIYPGGYCWNQGNPHAPPILFVNNGGAFVPHDFYADGLTVVQREYNDLLAWADFDSSGTIDLVARFNDPPTQYAGYMSVLMNQAISYDTIIVSVLGDNGERNQAGRVVRLTPDARPNVTMTQVVDGGSGYLSNGPYDLTFAAPYPGAYTVSVRFANATYTTTARVGDHVTMYANGTFTVQ